MFEPEMNTAAFVKIVMSSAVAWLAISANWLRRSVSLATRSCEPGSLDRTRIPSARASSMTAAGSLASAAAGSTVTVNGPAVVPTLTLRRVTVA